MSTTRTKNITLTRTNYDLLVKHGSTEIAARDNIDHKAIGFVTRWSEGECPPRTAGYTEKNATTRRVTVKLISNQYGDKWLIEIVNETTVKDYTVRGAENMTTKSEEMATRRQADQMIEIATANVDKGSVKSSAAQCLKDARECYVAGTRVEHATGKVGEFLPVYYHACMWALRSLSYSVGLGSTEYAKAKMVFESYEVEPATKLGANNEIPAGRGRIEDVSHLVQKWNPGEHVTVIATGGGEGTDTEEGDLRFNLVITYGSGKHAVTYAKGIDYKNFTEYDIGRSIGQIEMYHAALCDLRRHREAADLLPVGAEQSTYKSAVAGAILQLPMMGWRLIVE